MPSHDSSDSGEDNVMDSKGGQAQCQPQIKNEGDQQEQSREDLSPILTTHPPARLDCKITLFAQIPALAIRKSIRLLPSETLSSFIVKLRKKRILSQKVHNEQITILHRRNQKFDESRQLPPIGESNASLWQLGIGDQDWLVILFDLISHMPVATQVTPSSSAPSAPLALLQEPTATTTATMAPSNAVGVERPCSPSNLTEGGSGKECKKEKTKESLLGRFRNAARTLAGSASSLSLYSPTSVGTVSSPEGELLFGVPLEVIAKAGAPLMGGEYGVPAFLESGLAFLEKYESHTEGLFRLSGSATSIKTYRRALERGETIRWMEGGKDVHNITGLIKLYLRELPEPLLTFDLFPAFCDAIRIADSTMRLKAFLTILAALPKANYNLLCHLIRSLARLCLHEEHTKMGIANLATLIGPNLGWPACSTEQGSQEIFASASAASNVTAYLLSQQEWLFPPGERQESDSAPFLALAKAIFDYDSKEPDELPLKIGKHLYVTGIEEMEGWWEGMLCEEQAGSMLFGKFPHNYVCVLWQQKEVEKQKEKEEKMGEITPDQPIESEISPGQPDQEADSMDKEATVEGEKGPNTFSNDPKIIQNSPILQEEMIATRIDRLEQEIARLSTELAEERQQREQLSSLVPQLVSNQDQVLRMLQELHARSTSSQDKH